MPGHHAMEITLIAILVTACFFQCMFFVLRTLRQSRGSNQNIFIEEPLEPTEEGDVRILVSQ